MTRRMQGKDDAGILMTGMGSVLHFLVDGLCVCCLYAMVAPFGVTHLVGIFIMYTLMAFATQPLTGLWADAMRWKHWMLLLGDVLLALGALVASLALVASSVSAREVVMFAASTLLGAGNSLFHVWGGKQTVLTTGNDPRALGVFVSTGAFGLAVGGLFFSWSLAYAFLLLICGLSVGVVALEEREFKEEGGERREERDMPCELGDCLEVNAMSDASENIASKREYSLSSLLSPLSSKELILALMMFVSFRSSVSEVFSSGMVKGGYMILVIGATAMLGKMAGGWIARWLGVARAFVALLLATLTCWAVLAFVPVGSLGAWPMLLGLFLINCTMPITLYWANAVLKGREGLAFGLLAAALIPGYLLATL